jgi:tol-pal system protein YbgF
MSLVRRAETVRWATWALLPLCCSLALHSAAAQQDLRPLLDRVQRMERDLSVLQQQVYGGKPPPSGTAGGAGDTEATVAATVRVSQLESDLRTTTGQLEEINFAVGQLRQRLDRLVTDLDFRLGALEKIASGQPASSAAAAAPATAAATAGPAPVAGIDTPASSPDAPAPDQPAPTLGAPPRNLGTIPLSADRSQTAAAPGGIASSALSPGAPGPTAIVPPTQAATQAATTIRLPPGSPKDQYDYAFDLLKRAEYAQAEQALRQFVTAYPHDPLAGNAQYWLAETFYVRNNYSEAAAQFLKGYQTYPQSPKAADNLFKLGLTLTILGKVQEACSAYQRFDREYASAAGALKRRVVDERQRLGCA